MRSLTSWKLSSRQPEVPTKRPPTRLLLENLETRETPAALGHPLDLAAPSVPAVARTQAAPAFNLYWNYLTYNPSPTTSLPITGQVKATNPDRLTGTFQVQLFWSDRATPDGRTSLIANKSFQLTQANYTSAAFSVSAAEVRSHPRPSWATHLVAKIVPGAQLPDSIATDNVTSMKLPKF